LSPFQSIHQKEWIAVDVEVFGDMLDFFPAESLAVSSPFHLPQFTNNKLMVVSGQVRGSH
jgi:hypothetical protein